MTLKDIARLAGVSPMTVSNVINGKYNKVSKKTIDDIQKIIKEYHYVPNLNARTLVAKTSHIILVVIPLYTSKLDSTFYTPYISSLIGMIESQLREQHYFTMIRSVCSINELTNIFNSWIMDGAIILLPDFDQYIERLLKASKVPLVFLDSYADFSTLYNVRCNDEMGGFLSTSFLIHKGHKNIAFMGDYKNSPVIQRRYLGYLRALKENQLLHNDDIIYEAAPTYENGLQVGVKLAKIKDSVSAIVTSSDTSAIGLIESLHKNGVRVPNEISVIGFDDLPLCEYITPKLTSVNQNLLKKASSTVELLLSQINATCPISQNHTRTIDIDVNVVERNSVAVLNT